jgi:hypothetical protein
MWEVVIVEQIQLLDEKRKVGSSRDIHDGDDNISMMMVMMVMMMMMIDEKDDDLDDLDDDDRL